MMIQGESVIACICMCLSVINITQEYIYHVSFGSEYMFFPDRLSQTMSGRCQPDDYTFMGPMTTKNAHIFALHIEILTGYFV